MANKQLDFQTTRVNYNLPTKLVNKVKEYSKEMGVPTTYGVVLLLTTGLNNYTTLRELPKINKFIDDYNLGKYDKDSIKVD
jgi:hypothetical protein